MITFEQALYARDFHMVDRKHDNADGTPRRWRRNGQTKTWKTRPGEFKVPVKHGLRDYGYITNENAQDFNVGDGIDPDKTRGL